MTSLATGKDRRQHTRYDIASGGFALLQTNDIEVLGSIKDISSGGLSLSHIDENVEIDELSSIFIKLISENICSGQLSGKTLWSKSEEGGFTTSTIKMKRRGVKFAQLNNEKQAQLNEFIASLNKK